MYHVLIADDEAIECHVLALMIKNHFSQLTLLPHASNGLELIAGIETHHPEIVIVDINMPGLNGLDALDMVRQKNSHMKILIVSAYSEFHYAKKALVLDAVDYILKPVQPDEFVRAIQKICDDLDQEQVQLKQAQKHQAIASEFDQVVEEDFLSNLILGEISPKNAMRLLQSLKSPYRGGILMTLRPAPLPDLSLSFPWEKYAFSLLEQLSHLCTCFGKLYRRDFILCLLPGMSFDKDFYQNWVREIFQIALQRSDPTFRCPLLCGVSSVKLNLNELTDAFKESVLALHQKVEPDLYFFEFHSPCDVVDPYQEIFELCLSLLKKQNLDGCIQKMDTVFLKEQNQEESFSFFKVRTSYFLFRLNQAFLPPLSCSELPHDSWIFFWDLLSPCETPDCLRVKVRAGLEAILSHKAFWNHPENPHIARSILYMRQHYMEDLSLDLVAKVTKVSPFYLSRLFKQELDRNFLEVLTTIRIQRAIELLPDSRLTVREISEQVGYLNTTYFYKVFKKYVGINVGEMREYLLRYPAP